MLKWRKSRVVVISVVSMMIALWITSSIGGLCTASPFPFLLHQVMIMSTTSSIKVDTVMVTVTTTRQPMRGTMQATLISHEA